MLAAAPLFLALALWASRLSRSLAPPFPPRRPFGPDLSSLKASGSEEQNLTTKGGEP